MIHILAKSVNIFAPITSFVLAFTVCQVLLGDSYLSENSVDTFLGEYFSINFTIGLGFDISCFAFYWVSFVLVFTVCQILLGDSYLSENSVDTFLGEYFSHNLPPSRQKENKIFFG